jgi:hypothetical protein
MTFEHWPLYWYDFGLTTLVLLIPRGCQKWAPMAQPAITNPELIFVLVKLSYQSSDQAPGLGPRREPFSGYRNSRGWPVASHLT